MLFIELSDNAWQFIMELQGEREFRGASLQQFIRAAVHDTTHIQWGDGSDNFAVIRCTAAEALDLLNWCDQAAETLQQDHKRADQAPILRSAANAVRAGIRRGER
jgi:hypothetical protein